MGTRAVHITMTQCILLSQNLRGARKPGNMARVISTFQRMCNQGLSALCAQEHNLSPTQEQDLMRLATTKNLTLVIGFAPPAPDGVHRGGTFILINNNILTFKKTILKTKDLTIVDVDWGGRPLQIASAYAPAKALARVNFFQTIHTHLTPNTIVGGDWNCVTDVTTDVISQNPLAYHNIGQSLLAQRLGSLGLQDERGDQLNGTTETTRVGNSRNGYISTRLDRWYTPSTNDFSDILWSFTLINNFIFKSTASDHMGVILTIDAQQGDLGHDRQTIREDLIMDREIQQHILACLKEAYKGHGSAAKKWGTAMNSIKDYLMKETAKRRHKESVQIKRKLAMLNIIAIRLKRDKATTNYLNLQKRLQKEIYELRFPETKPIPTNENAHRMHQKSDTCTKQQFQPFKDQAKKNWINKINVAEWEEDVAPQFTSTTTHTSQVAAEFGKYYKMLYGPKK